MCFFRMISTVAVFVTSIIVSNTGATKANDPSRLLRKDSFIGIHFDFHAGKEDQNIGANTTPEMVQTIIDMIRPDFIQVDSKGHSGWCSYPTKVGAPSPGVVTDSLKVWREVTAQNGVALYTHYSGIWDSAAIAHHPEWAVVDRMGNRSTDITSVFSSYKSDLLVPQLLEFALKYETDGVWIDGECWATRIDYSDKAIEAFKNSTKREQLPVHPSSDSSRENKEAWYDWCQFHREAFRQYLRDYVSTVKSKAPSFQIASNWAFTDHMADPVSAPVDFISGDFSPCNSINAARYSTRLMANQGKPWDLMAWSFASVDGNWESKTGIQLSREAACVLSQGGAFQAYFTQNRDGSVTTSKLGSMVETAKFCRERQTLCHHSTGVPQVALFCPTETHYRSVSNEGESLFPMIQNQRPFLNSLLENNYSVEVLTDSALADRIMEYPVVLFCNTFQCSDKLKSKLYDYVTNGGSIVLVGNESIQLVTPLLGKLEERNPQFFSDYESLQFHRCGQGTVVTYDISTSFSSDLLQVAMKVAFPLPMIEFTDKQQLDVSIRKTQSGTLTVNLVNVSGPHEIEPIIEEIAPVTYVQTLLRLPECPQLLRLEPSGIDLPFKWQAGIATFFIPAVPVHEIIVIQ